jgi:hypothetical protein
LRACLRASVDDGEVELARIDVVDLALVHDGAVDVDAELADWDLHWELGRVDSKVMEVVVTVLCDWTCLRVIF